MHCAFFRSSPLVASAAFFFLAASLSAGDSGLGGKAYVSNTDSDTVSVVDLSSRTVLGVPLPVGTEPRGSALDPAGSFLYVPNRFSNNVSIISTITDSVVSTVAVTGQEPYNLAVMPDGASVYVVCKGSGTVSVIDAGSRMEVDSVQLPGSKKGSPSPEGIAITPDSTKVYIVDRGLDLVYVVSTATNQIIAGPLPAPSAARDAKVSEDGGTVIVVGEGAPVIINTADDTVVKVQLADIGAQRDVDVDGDLAYVTNFSNSLLKGLGSLDVYDLNTAQYVDSIPLSGEKPYGVAVSPDGRWAWVTFQDSNSLGFVDLVERVEVDKPVAVGSGPRGVSALVGSALTEVESFILPRTLRLRLAGEGLDSLAAAGFFDDGGAAVDYTQPVTVRVGGFLRTFTLVPNAAGTSFRFRDENVSMQVRPNLRGSSRGLFRLKLSRTTLAGLIDPDADLDLHFQAVGLEDASGVVRLTDGVYRLGRVRGTLVSPPFFPAKARILTSDERPDVLSLSGGFATEGAVPAALGDVQIAVGPEFEVNIPGAEFVRSGDRFAFTQAAEESAVAVTIDFAREVIRLRARGIEVGALGEGTTDIIVNAGAGGGAVRVQVRLGGEAPKQFY
jgi:YVTN family beta-propeller protein